MPAEKVEIVTDNGITVKAMAPGSLSRLADRRTFRLISLSGSFLVSKADEAT